MERERGGEAEKWEGERGDLGSGATVWDRSDGRLEVGGLLEAREWTKTVRENEGSESFESGYKAKKEESRGDGERGAGEKRG